MKHSQEKIISALNVIKDVCKEQERCQNCPFGTEAIQCKIKFSSDPRDWDIAEPIINWRAFNG